MPMYSYVCSVCGATVDRRCSYAEREKQRCRKSELVLAIDPNTGKPATEPCNGLLVREGPEGHARMLHQWSGQ